jgi:hypothetical protein
MKQLSTIVFASSLLGCIGDNATPAPEHVPQPHPACLAGYESDGSQCVDIDECVVANTCGTETKCVNGQGGFDCLPMNCVGVQQADDVRTDGEYTLYIGGDPAKPFDAYCADMATLWPAEYVTLKTTAPSANYSQYTAGGASYGTTVITSYSKLRIDPSTLAVDIDDERFATSSGQLFHSGHSNEPVTSMPFGVAMSCDNAMSGRANIDLRGLPFTYEGSFATNAIGMGSIGSDPAHQQFTLEGGGFCGWMGVQGAAYNPFNTNGGGFVLQLSYIQ